MALCTVVRFVLVAIVLSPAILCCYGEIHRIRKQVSGLKYQRNRERNVDDSALWDSGLQQDDTTKYDDTDGVDSKKDFACAILATLLVGLTGIIPLALPLDTKKGGDGTDGTKRLNLFLSFAVGGLLGDVFLHLLPEGFSHFKPDDRSARVTHGVFLMTGMLVFYILEVVFSDPQEDESPHPNLTDIMAMTNGHTMANGTTSPVQRKIHKDSVKNGIQKDNNANKVRENGVCSHKHEDKPNSEKKQVTGYLNLLANFIDNFTHGLAVGGSFMVSSKVGWHTTLAILLHEAPHEIGDFAILLRSGFSRWEAAKAQMSTSVGGLIGCSVALLAESAEVAGTSSAWILPFTSGGFLNIALVTIVPDLMKETSAKESFKQVLCVLLGVSVMALVNAVSEH